MGANFNMNLLRNGRLGRHMRLKDYDYSRPGGYFVTTVTRGRKNLFGRIVNGVMGLNELGCIVVDEWLHMVDMREGMELDEFIMLPNHFHAIVIFYEQNKPGNQSVASTQRVAPDNYQARATRWVDATGRKQVTLGTIVGQFKSRVTKRIWAMEKYSRIPIWQRDYYDHIIRDDNGLNRIREYIITNPLRWEIDKENPERKGEDEFDIWIASIRNRP